MKFKNTLFDYGGEKSTGAESDSALRACMRNEK